MFAKIDVFQQWCCEKNEKIGNPPGAGTCRWGRRSKIEDKLTEENKLTEERIRDRESAAHANTPWAPSGPERIEVAYGKVPLWAWGERMFAKIHVFQQWCGEEYENS